MNTRKLIALVLSVVMIAGCAATVSAASFPDITSNYSWAAEAIDDMASRGVLKGYTDGTFKPEKSVSHLESLIIAARIMGVDNEENSDYRNAAVKAYSSAVSQYETNYAAEVSYLLYWNVISQDELSSYLSESAKNMPLQRYEAAVLLTKMVGGNIAAVGSSFVLSFDDAALIPSSAKAYVKYVSDAGLMNGVGGNNFDPSGELTRAMIATMMNRGEKYMNASSVYGTLQSVGSSTVSISVSGNVRTVSIPGDALIKLDGATVSLSALEAGKAAAIHYQGDAVRLVESVSIGSNATVSGIVTSITETNGQRKIAIKTASGSESYPINTSICTYRIDNKFVTFGEIPSSSYATLTVRNGSVIDIFVETGSKTAKGTIKEIIISDSAAGLVITDSDGSDKEYVFAEDVSIYRNSSLSDIKSLAEGDSVTLTITNGCVSRLVATSKSSSIKGTITKIVISSSSSVAIKTGSSETEYGITSDTKFTVDGKSDCSIYDLRLGATAEVRLDSTNISSISTSSVVVSPTLTGVITYIHPTSYVMGLNVYDSATGETNEIQTVVKSSVKVTDTTSSRITTFKALEPGMTVVAVGSSSYGVYEVTQIIVTAGVN